MKIIATAIVGTAIALASSSALAYTQPAPLAGHAQASQHAGNVNMNKVGYAIGYDVGKNFKSQGINITEHTFSMGMRAGLSGSHPSMTEQQMKTVMQNFQKQMIQKMIMKRKTEGAANLKLSQDYMSRVSHLHGVKEIIDHTKTGTVKTGVYYKVLRQGHGLVPKADDTVTVNYEGTLPPQKGQVKAKVFDSSYKRGQPSSFKVDQVIPGWQDALKHMPVGSTWVIYIPSSKAYGVNGPQAIGPNQALTFKVHLIKIVPAVKTAATHPAQITVNHPIQKK